jgi:hypothetical protein
MNQISRCYSYQAHLSLNKDNYFLIFVVEWLLAWRVDAGLGHLTIWFFTMIAYVYIATIAAELS